MAITKSILAPIPGVFYRRPSSKEGVYVQEGQAVKCGDIIGLVEIMKTYFEIKAEEDATIVSFIVKDEEMIEAGQEIALVQIK